MAVIDDMNKEEKEAVEELRMQLKGLNLEKYDTTTLLYNFLKARNFNLSEAEEMLKKHLQWRNKYSVDTILDEYKPPEVLEKYIPQNRFAFNKDGCPVRYFPSGTIDAIGIRLSSKTLDFLKTVIQLTESDKLAVIEQSKKLGKRVPGVFYIFNMENLSFTVATDKKCVELFINVCRMYQDNYPECLKAVYVINASTYFTLFYSIIKNFLAPEIINKIRIFGAETWKEDLLKEIDADQLPAFLGGTRTDPDGNPLCKTFIDHGSPVPESYYIHKSKKSLSQAPDAKKLVLQRASFSEVTVQVDEAGSLIEWEFETKCRDIGFGFFYQEMIGEEEKITELVSLQRIDTEDYSETGMYKCERAGTYIILFDNSYSWLRSKEIYYTVKVVSPKDHEAQLSY